MTKRDIDIARSYVSEVSVEGRVLEAVVQEEIELLLKLNIQDTAREGGREGEREGVTCHTHTHTHTHTHARTHTHAHTHTHTHTHTAHYNASVRKARSSPHAICLCYTRMNMYCASADVHVPA